MRASVSSILLFFSLILLPFQAAFAARGAIVDVDSEDLREGPGPNFKSSEKLSRGMAVTSSNVPTEGYYKVRTATGTIGFVRADTLVLQPIADQAEGSAALPEAAPRPSKSSRKEGLRARFKMFGGYNFFGVSDVNDHLGADVLKYGYSAGAELEYQFLTSLAAVVRSEYVFKSVTALDRVSNKSYDIGVSSIPIMAGLSVTLGSGTGWSSHLAVLGGVAPATSLSATSTSEAEPNVTSIPAFGYAGIAKLDVLYSFGSYFLAFAEGGYRYLTTPQLTSEVAGNGSTIFQRGGVDVPISINLNGPFVSAGVGVEF